MSDVDVDIEWTESDPDQLIDKLDSFERAMGNRAESAMQEATLRIQADAQRKVPVDTGRLRSSIGQEVRSGRGSVTGIVGSNVEYAPFIELGTSRMGAQPYLRPALEENRRTIRRLVKQAVRQAVRDSK